MELITIASVQYAAYLCNIHLLESGDIEFVYAIKALHESWQNYLIFMQEIYMKAHDPDNVYL